MMNETDRETLRAKEEAERLAYEARTTGAMVNGQPVTIAELRKAFDAVQNPKGWKLPVYGRVTHDRIRVTVEAVIFFHGAKPEATVIDERYAIVEGAGYAG